MSKEVVTLRYDGPDLADHKIDVAILAPALQSFGELIRQTNFQLNSDRVEARVLINADLQANCVTINLDVVVGLYNQVVAFVQQDHIRSAKELLEWLGLLGLPTGLGLLAYLTRKGSKPVKSKNVITDSSGNTVIQIEFEGNNNHVIVAPEVLELAENPRILAAVKGVVRPLQVSSGIDSATFSSGDGKHVERVSKEAAAEIMSIPSPEHVPEDDEISTVTGHIVIHSPVFDEKAKVWKFLYGDKVEKIDISETTIAQTILSRGKAVVGDSFKVKMEVWETPQGRGYRNNYKVIEVLGFKPGLEQPGLTFGAVDQNPDDEQED